MCSSTPGLGRFLVFAAVAVSALLVAVPAASATGPGSNGELLVHVQDSYASGGARHLDVVNPDTGAVIRRSATPALNSEHVVYSHDGLTYAAFASGVNNNDHAIAVFDSATGTRINPGMVFGYVYDSLNKSNFAYVGGGENDQLVWLRSAPYIPNTPPVRTLVTTGLSGEAARVLGEYEVDFAVSQGGSGAFIASPVSAKLYTTIGWSSQGQGDPGSSHYGVYEFDLDSGARRFVFKPTQQAPNTHVALEANLGDISPDGRFLTWVRRSGASSYEVMLYDLVLDRGTRLHQENTWILPPRFAPDGTELLWFAGESDARVLHRGTFNFDPDDEGEAPPTLTGIRSVGMPVGRVLGFAWRPLGGARFDWAPAPGDPGLINFTSRVHEAVTDPLTVHWTFGDGSPQVDHAQSTTHRYAKPGSYAVRHWYETSTIPAKTGTTTRAVKVAAPELRVSLEWDEDEVEDDQGRLAIDRTFDAQVVVRATNDGIGDITGITFDEETLLTWKNGEMLDVEADDPNPGPFTLEPGEAREFDVRVTPRVAGRATIKSGIAGRDSADEPEEVVAELTKPVRIGYDFDIDIDAKVEHAEHAGSFVAWPEEGIELTYDEDTEEPIARAFKLDVAVKNVSGSDVDTAKLDVREILRAARAGQPPYTEHGIRLTKYRVMRGGQPAWTTIDPANEQAVLDIEIGDGDDNTVADGATVHVEFEGEAIRQSVLDLRAIARGVDNSGDAPQARSGNGTRTLRIDQDVVLVVEKTAGEFDPLTKAGENWRADVRITNVTEDVTVLARVLVERSGNIVGRTIGELGGVQLDAPGVVVELEPGDSFIAQGEFSSMPDGGTRGILALPVDGFVTEDADGEYLDPEDQRLLDPLEIVVRERASGVPANQFRKAIDTTNPAPVPFASWSEAGWVFTDSFARGFSKWAEQSIQAGRAVKTHVLKADVYAWEFLTFVKAHLDPAVQQRSYDEVVAVVQKLMNIRYADAKAKVDAAVQQAFIPSLTAWEASDYRSLTEQTGRFLGEQAPSKAIEAFIPQLLAARYVKYGGKTAVLKAQAEQTASFTTRIAQHGRKGFKPRDRVSVMHATLHWGMDRLTDSRLLEYARRKGIIIAVRDRSPGSIERLAQGALLKIEKIKAKNVNSIDVEYLGFSPDHKDLAMIKQMPNEHSMQARLQSISDPELRAKVKARYEQRRAEYEELLPELQAYERRGSVPVPSRDYGLNPNSNSGGIEFDGVWDKRGFQLPKAGTNGIANTSDGLPAFQPQMLARPGDTKFQPFTGDVDPIAFLDETGEILSLERRMEVYEELAELGIQHPESLTWDNAAGRAAYLSAYDMANGNAEALLAYLPDGTRRAVMFDSRKSRWEVDQNAHKRALMFFDGLDRVDKAKKVTEGVVKFAKDLIKDKEPYFGPGDGAQMGSGDDLPLLRRNEDGTYSQWTEGGGWSAYAPPPGQPVAMTAQTALTEDVQPGDTRLPIVEQPVLGLSGSGHHWFKAGDQIVINPGGATEERHVVQGLGSIILTVPLQRAHVPGELVGVVPRRSPAKQPDPQLPVVAPKPRPGVMAARGTSAIDGQRRAVVATVACPAIAGACRIDVPRSVSHAIGGKRFTSRVAAPASVRAGASAPVHVVLTAPAVKQLTRRSTRVAVVVRAANEGGSTATTASVALARGRGSARASAAVVRVPASGRVLIGRTTCPAGAGACRVVVPRSVRVRIGGAPFALTTSVPTRMRAGATANLWVSVPKAAHKHLPTSATGAGLVRVRLGVRITNEGGTALANLSVRLRR